VTQDFFKDLFNFLAEDYRTFYSILVHRSADINVVIFLILLN